MNKEGIIHSQVPKEVWDRRGRTARLGETIFGDICEFQPSDWQSADRFIRNDEGLIVVANHPTLLDGPRIVALLMQNPEFRGRKILLPVAQHQFKVSSLLNEVMGIELELISVVTPDTVRKHPKMATQARQGLFEYGKRAGETLANGGVVILFPQAERRARIDAPLPGDRATEIMVRIAEKRGKNCGVLPIGISVPGVEPEAAHGLNPGRKYLLRVGEAVSREELVQTAAADGTTIDAQIYKMLSGLVSEPYR